MRFSSFCKLAAVSGCAAILTFAATGTMPMGKAELKSAGALAFAPDGILLVGDSVGASILALDVNDRTPAAPGGSLEIKGVVDKLAAMLGTSADQIAIQDVVVNPISKNVYISVSRGKGPDAVPVILRADHTGKITEVSLDNIGHSQVALADGPQDAKQRMETITQLKY